jgi:hypothetical protein
MSSILCQSISMIVCHTISIVLCQLDGRDFALRDFWYFQKISDLQLMILPMMATSVVFDMTV